VSIHEPEQAQDGRRGLACSWAGLLLPAADSAGLDAKQGGERGPGEGMPRPELLDGHAVTRTV